MQQLKQLTISTTMKLILITLATFFLACWAHDLTEEWEHFKERFDKNYLSEEEVRANILVQEKQFRFWYSLMKIFFYVNATF